MVELGLDGVEILENVRMIVLKIVDDQRLRTVVDELRAPVEIRSIVLVGFNDEKRALPKAGRYTEVVGDAADQETRIKSSVLQNPRNHARCRSLAVSSRDRNHPSIS